MLINFIKVSGAGTASANDLYKENGVQNGKPYYENDLNEIKWAPDNRWKIAEKSGNVYYMSSDDVATPDLATYNMIGVGEEPYPTVEAVTFEDLKITGAGISKVNSCYKAYAIANGKPKYKKKGIWPVQLETYIENTGDAWEIHGAPPMPESPIPQYYVRYEEVETPDLVEYWEVDKDGIDPVPVISVGCPVFISAISEAVKRNRG